MPTDKKCSTSAIPSNPKRCVGHGAAAVVLVSCWALGIAILPIELCAGAGPADAPIFSGADLEYFEKQVRPLLAEHCYECHSATAETLEGGLRLDSRASILAGGDTEAAVVPGDPEQSLLIASIEYGDLYEMPPTSKLPDAMIAIFRE